MKKRIRKNREIYSLAMQGVILQMEQMMLDIMREKKEFKDANDQQKMMGFLITVSLAQRLGLLEDLFAVVSIEIADIILKTVDLMPEIDSEK